MLFGPHLTHSLGCICWLFISCETLHLLSLSKTCQLPPSGTKSLRGRDYSCPAWALHSNNPLYRLALAAILSYCYLPWLDYVSWYDWCTSILLLYVLTRQWKRHKVLVLRGSVNVCVLVNPETVMCVCFHYWPCASTSWKGGRGLGCLCLCLVWVLYIGPVERSTLSMALYAPGPVSSLCACVSGMRAQLRYRLNWQTVRWQLSPSAWVETPGPWAEHCAGVARQEGVLGWSREPCS